MYVEKVEEEDGNTIELTQTSQHRVYYIVDDISPVEHHIQDFDSFEAAEQFCKEQYYLINHAFPFIPTGYGSSYHPTGNRPKFDVSQCTLVKPQMYQRADDAHGYFLILSPTGNIKTYSAGVYDVWE